VQEFGLGALFGETNAPPLKEFLKNYSEFIEVSNSHGERTVELYDEIVPRVLKACTWPPTSQELLRYWKGRIDDKEIRPITANKERRAVHSALQWAVKGGLLSENPCSRVPQFELAEGQKEVKDDWYTDDELQNILEWLPDRYRPLVLWAWATGMRLSECLNLRWEDLDTKVRVKGKGRKVRHLPMSRPMIQILQEIPQVEMGPFPFTRHQVSTAFYRARAQAKINKGEFHALRDTFARNFLLAGGDIYRLSRILGHSSVRVTEQYYAHLIPEDLKAPMDAILVENLLKTLSVARKDKGHNPDN